VDEQIKTKKRWQVALVVFAGVLATTSCVLAEVAISVFGVILFVAGMLLQGKIKRWISNLAMALGMVVVVATALYFLMG